jgi:hypothetical protein
MLGVSNTQSSVQRFNETTCTSCLNPPINKIAGNIIFFIGMLFAQNAFSICIANIDQVCGSSGVCQSIFPDAGSGLAFYQSVFDFKAESDEIACRGQYVSRETYLQQVASSGEATSFRVMWRIKQATSCTPPDPDGNGNRRVLSTRVFTLDSDILLSCSAPKPVKISLHRLPANTSEPVKPHALVEMLAKVTQGDLPKPNVAVQLSVDEVTQPGGSPLNDASRPKGQLSPMAGISDTSGNVNFTFKAPKGTSLHRIKAQCTGCENEAAMEIAVKMPDIVIGFFNGVSNTEKAASQSAKRLEAEYGDKYKDTPLKYDLFYNQTACGAGFGKVSCLEDVAEVFEQRSKELDGVFANRWEVFWDILAGRQRSDGSLTGRLLSLLGDGANALLQWLDSTANAVMNQLASAILKLLTLFTNAPTNENQAEHLARLTEHADRGSGFILVAHSQGNLFVNSAYDALIAAEPNAEAKVVHVAPASPTLRGQHILADIDLVINGLRTTGINTVPPANVNLPFSSIDASGHGFEPTYMDKARNAYARTKELITNSLQALVP